MPTFLFLLVDLHCCALPSFICLLFCVNKETFSPNREKLQEVDFTLMHPCIALHSLLMHQCAAFISLSPAPLQCTESIALNILCSILLFTHCSCIHCLILQQYVMKACMHVFDIPPSFIHYIVHYTDMLEFSLSLFCNSTFALSPLQCVLITNLSLSL